MTVTFNCSGKRCDDGDGLLSRLIPLERCDDGNGLLSRLIPLERVVMMKTGYCHV